jgi:hypothetical protein
MSSHDPRYRSRRLASRLSPRVEPLEARELLAVSVLRHSIGPFVAGATVGPRVNLPAPKVDAHTAINAYLAGVLGPSIQDIQSQAQARDVAARSFLAERVLTTNFFNGVLSDLDTYTLLNSAAMGALIGFNQVSNGQQTADSVSYVISATDILSVTADTSIVQIPASGSASGFIASVPTSGLRTLPDGSFSVLVPLDQIPPDAPVPQTTTTTTGSLSQVFSNTGDNLEAALSSGSPLRAPNAPRTVPGLRLIRLLGHSPIFPGAARPAFLRMLRIAVQRNLFDLTAVTQQRIDAGLTQLVQTVDQLGIGTFQPSVPPPQVNIPAEPLAGTLQISSAAFQNLSDVNPILSGLQLPGIGNFPGRLDVGYVFDLSGNYGLSLTLRGPLLDDPGNLNSANIVGGDVQIEISNAANITALNGLRTVEATTLGSVLDGGVSAANTDQGGVTTFAGSIGYGSGFEFGTGIGYTQIIPLGNVFSLIPQFPKT